MSSHHSCRIVVDTPRVKDKSTQKTVFTGDESALLIEASLDHRRNKVVLVMIGLSAYSIAATGCLARLALPSPVSFSSVDKPKSFDPSVSRVRKIHTRNGQKTRIFKSQIQQLKQPKYFNQEYTCDAQDAAEYLPETDLIRRSLHGIIIGSMKGGTQALHTNLLTHPKILSSGMHHGELHFFNRLYKDRRPNNGKVYRQNIRDAFARVIANRGSYYSQRNGMKDIASQQNKHKVGIHSAPIYLFSGRKIVARMLCAAPWVKATAILRNPIDRAFSQYHFIYSSIRKKGKHKPSFDQFILDDITLLKETGVLLDWNTTSFNSYAGSEEEFQAWEQYLHYAKANGPVGRGLYSIQLEILLDEFKKYNKSRDDLLVLQSESSKEYPQETYHQAIQFLGREARTVRKHRHVFAKDHHATKYLDDAGISEGTKKMLYELYQPYNERLYNLLGTDEWTGVWDE
ncbi:hypothetical protein HJC23_002113 [Cyclotella cryptica]|uniref:Sulfotransferase domain-containing protein n=1 Tax=Cyclotella cryptica TaxID=29204 RepID=A0ABD3Q2V4_9STRA|eukprot:CCRYP_009668-RA/>CCRYP_009668-RA protein AED:0.01 eAED:0.01 QI:141/1/1/1/1/1/2/364/456